MKPQSSALGRVRDAEKDRRNRRAYEANQQPVVTGGPGSGKKPLRTGSVGAMDATQLRTRLNKAVAEKSGAKMLAIKSAAEAWLQGGNSQDNQEVQNILNAASKLAKTYGS